jgi:hypothetical protein
MTANRGYKGPTKTGGNIAVVALGSTGCAMMFSSSPSSPERLEFDLNLLVVVVFCVSALCNGLAKREDTLPLCRTDNYNTVHQHPISEGSKAPS